MTHLLILALLGALLTLTLAPFYVAPLVFLTLPALWRATASAPTAWRAFLYGWCFGLGYFIAGLYWISYSLLVDEKAFGWLVPLAVPGISAVFALSTGLTGLLVWRFRDIRGLRGALVFALAWTLGEWLRGHLFDGFPWNLLGYVWGASDATLQSAALFGVYGLSFLAAFLGVLPAVLLTETTARQKYAAAALLIFIIGGLGGYGAWRLSSHPTQLLKGTNFRLVQANIPQALKWDPKARMSNLRQYVTLTTSEDFDRVTHVIWPESALPFVLEADSELARDLAMVVPDGGFLFTGVARGEGERIYNSVKALDAHGNIVLVYDKRMLVPFGEYVPFRKLLPIAKLTPGSRDFSEGASGSAYVVPGLPPAHPLICYEAIFPELSAGAYPGWLLAITNDGWFGDSTGPYQHLAMARMRSVEQGAPMLRAAGTGITAVIDAYGRVLQALPLNATGVLDTPLPTPATSPTPYGRFGNGILFVMLVGSLLILFLPHLKRS